MCFSVQTEENVKVLNPTVCPIFYIHTKCTHEFFLCSISLYVLSHPWVFL